MTPHPANMNHACVHLSFCQRGLLNFFPTYSLAKKKTNSLAEARAVLWARQEFSRQRFDLSSAATEPAAYDDA